MLNNLTNPSKCVIKLIESRVRFNSSSHTHLNNIFITLLYMNLFDNLNNAEFDYHMIAKLVWRGRFYRKRTIWGVRCHIYRSKYIICVTHLPLWLKYWSNLTLSIRTWCPMSAIIIIFSNVIYTDAIVVSLLWERLFLSTSNLQYPLKHMAVVFRAEFWSSYML